MRLKSIKIKKFRHIKNEIEFTFGAKLTAIVGKNGIGKSSMLGLIGHTCTAPNDCKTIDNKSFQTQYSEIFAFSFPVYDKPGDHDYEVVFENEDENKIIYADVTSFARKEAGQEQGLRLRVKSHEEKNGEKTKAIERKVKFPVIYLGLKRLFPLVQEGSSYRGKLDLNTKEVRFYKDSYNYVMSSDINIHPQRVHSRTKNHIAVTTDDYDVYGNSAGQDNLGQILSAIISFRKLKESEGIDYQGGILLIDEIDATMFTGALLKLVQFLQKQATDLQLQIIFTTHSIDLLEALQGRNFKHHSRCCYLYKERGQIKCNDVQNEELGYLTADLRNDIYKPTSRGTRKLEVWVEDSEAAIFLKNILDKATLSKITIQQKFQFGSGELLNLVNRKIPIFRDGIITLDGDARQQKKTNVKTDNVVFLPKNERPENILYDFLKDLDESDLFWGGLGGYTKSFFLANQPSNIADRVVMKKWFNAHLLYWGKTGKKLFDRWKEDNDESVVKFNEEFEKILNRKLEGIRN